MVMLLGRSVARSWEHLHQLDRHPAILSIAPVTDPIAD
jgi:hypothetical protein